MDTSVRVRTKTSLFRHLTQLAMGLCAVHFLMGCAVKGSVTSVKDQLQDAAVHDFLKSTISASQNVIANGTAVLTVIIDLIDLNGNPVVGFVPTYVISSGAVSQSVACTESDSTGTSTCSLRATVPGVKHFKVTNTLTEDLEIDVTFIPTSLGQSITGLASASTIMNGAGAGGWQIKGSIGIPQSNTLGTGAGGWKVYGSLQSALTSSP